MYQPCPKPQKRKKQARKLSRDLVLEVFQRDFYTCQYCGQMFPPLDHDLDCQLHAHHIKHVSQGGQDCTENLTTACWKCHADHGRISRIDREIERLQKRKLKCKS